MTFAELPWLSGPIDFAARLFFLSFIALVIYSVARTFYLAEDINRGRTSLSMLVAPVIVRIIFARTTGLN